MKPALTLLLILLFELSNAQCSIQGKIVDKATREPLAGISVFVSNTTKGSATNTKGEFILDNLKPGKYELVITSVNYTNIVLPVQATEKAEMLTVELEPKSAILKEVVVETFDKDGWDKWGDTFLSYLVGSSEQAKACVLTNPEVVKFQFSSKFNKLRAFSNESLVFENRDLGYKIIYQLENFELGFSSNTFSFKGYPLFQELKPSHSKEMARWNKLRSNIYHGSLRHFMRSLYENKLASDGFEVRKIRFITAEEVRRVKKILKSTHGKTDDKFDRDSLNYYEKVKNVGSGDSIITLGGILPADSILVRSTAPGSKLLYFRGSLQVEYLNKKNPDEFAKTLPLYRKNESIHSDISLRSDTPVMIYPNGNYSNGLDLLIGGYWAWSEKIATMLPGDYWPDKK